MTLTGTITTRDMVAFGEAMVKNRTLRKKNIHKTADIPRTADVADIFVTQFPGYVQEQE